MNIKRISKVFHLTKSEERILAFISEGLTTSEIANSLKISIKTVESHRTNCIRKLKLEGKKNALLHFIIQNKYQRKN